MITMLEYWIRGFDLDGFRCDTASIMVPTSFWEEALATALTKIKPDIMMLAEADKPELLTNAFDIDYAWPMMNMVRKVLSDSAPASEIQHTWKKRSALSSRLVASGHVRQSRRAARSGLLWHVRRARGFSIDVHTRRCSIAL